MTIVEMKARVYDLSDLIHQAQFEIDQLNKLIAEETAKQAEETAKEAMKKDK